MNFKPGDLVIRKDGGNKMRIISCDSSSKKVDCYWFTDKNFSSSFDESEIIHLSQYYRIVTSEKRKDIISKFLEETF